MFNTKIITSILPVFTAFLLMIPVSGVFAQEQQEVVLPTVSAKDAVITQQTVESITGTFVVKNPSNDFISGVSYDISIISPRPKSTPGELTVDNAQEYIYRHVADAITLKPQEEKMLSFSIDTLPAIPVGPYRIRIQLISADGRRLDWTDSPITIQSTSSSKAFAAMVSGSVLVNSTDPATNETYNEWAPFEGVNVAPASTFELLANASHTGKDSLRGNIKTTIVSLLSQNPTPETFVGPEVLLVANSIKELRIPVTAPTQPGVYQITTTIQDADHNQISGVMRYQIVVTGASASIERLTLTKPAHKKGEIAEVFFSIVGPADRVTELDGKAVISLLSGTKVVGTTQAPVHLSPDAQTGTASIALTEDAEEVLGVQITVQDNTNTTLATSLLSFPNALPESDMPLQSATPEASAAIGKKFPYRYGVLLLILVSAIVTVYLSRRKKIAPPTLLLLLFVIAGFALVHPSLANVDGIQFFTCTKVSGEDNCTANHTARLSIVTKIEPSGPFRVGEPVNYDIKVGWRGCENASSNGTISVKVLKDGGEFINTRAKAKTASWTTLASQSVAIPRGRHGVQATYNRTFIGSTTFGPQLNDKTTLWTDGIIRWSQDSYTHDYTLTDFRWLPFWGSSDLSLTKTGPTTLELGQPVTYTVTVANAGPSESKNVVITDTVPAGLTFNSSASTPGCTLTGSNISCAIPTIAAAGSSAVTLVFSSTLPATCTAGSITNNATVTSDNPDPVQTNNASSVTTSTTCPVPVSVNLLINGSDTPTPVSVNTPITLSWASTNADTCSATGDWSGAKVATGSENTTPNQIRTYTYTITCTNTASGQTGTDTGSIVVNALAGDANKAPIAVAGILIDGRLSTFNNPIDVTQGTQVNVQLVATGSDDPDGWTHPAKGVANGGKCEWNSNLSNDGSLDTTIQNPAAPESCTIGNLASVVGYPIIFNDALGLRTYDLLRITDASFGASPVAQVRINIVARTYQCNDTTDNDSDGLIDTNDPGCHSDGNASNVSSYDPTDDDEKNTAALAQCSNGVDDGDSEDALADARDAGCHSDGNASNSGSYVPTDNDETNSASGNGGNGGSGSGGFEETR